MEIFIIRAVCLFMAAFTTYGIARVVKFARESHSGFDLLILFMIAGMFIQVLLISAFMVYVPPMFF